MVVMEARAKVSRMGDQMSSIAGMAGSSSLWRSVSVFLHHLGGLRTLHESEERFGCVIAGSAAKQHGVLPDRLIEVCRHDPSRATLTCDNL